MIRFGWLRLHLQFFPMSLAFGFSIYDIIRPKDAQALWLVRSAGRWFGLGTSGEMINGYNKI